MEVNTLRRIESELEVKAYIQNLKYALEHGATITFQEERAVDENRNPKFTNKQTVATLFHSKNALEALRDELLTLSVKEYMGTVKDTRYPDRSEMREFGRVYQGFGDVYIKVRVELFAFDGNHTTFVMSFHFAEIPFQPSMFPYKLDGRSI